MDILQIHDRDKANYMELLLIAYIVNHYKNPDYELYVGTGDCPTILRFYEKCGFVKSHVIKNFFIDNYTHPMYEDGRQLIDMVYLKRKL